MGMAVTSANLTEEQIAAHLHRVCVKCGEYFGRHKSTASECPVRDELQPQRFVGYKENQFFEEWIDDKS